MNYVLAVSVGTSLAFSIMALWFAMRHRVVLGKAVSVWHGKVIHSVLRLETDGDSVIISDDLKPHHGQEMIVIAFPLIFEKGGDEGGNF